MNKNGTGVVIIGRNEGERLRACLMSLAGPVLTAYVDSGSTDGSQDLAASFGVPVIPLGTPPGFTAARARNTGLRALLADHPDLKFVQMVDGDCEVAEGWITAAENALSDNPRLAAVFGRRRERHPERSIYNRLADAEWNVPIGRALSTGGDAMFRISALQQAGGYTESLIAGEEPDLCLRMRAAGWDIDRIDHAMTIHDAAMTHFVQWWRRTMRGGYAFAEHLARHGSNANPSFRRSVIRFTIWGGIIPLVVLMSAAAAATGIAGGRWIVLAGLTLYPLQAVRLAWRDRRKWERSSDAGTAAVLSLIGKFAELAGACRYLFHARRAHSATLIEYK